MRLFTDSFLVLVGSMKKLTSKTFENLPAITLYLSDLREILSILADSCEEVSFRTDGYNDVAISELDELVQNIESDRFSDIHIQAYRPYISVDLRSFGAQIYINENDTTQRGVASKIIEVFKSRERRYFGKVINVLTGVSILVCAFLFGEGEYKYAGAMMLGTLLSIPQAIKYQMRNKVIILTENRNLRPSFFKRRQDDIVIALVAAAVGAILSFTLVK